MGDLMIDGKIRKYFMSYYIQLVHLVLLFLIFILIWKYISIEGAFGTSVSILSIIMIVTSYFYLAKIKDGQSKKEEKESEPIITYMLISFVLGFLIYYSFYFQYDTYLPNGWDAPKYIYFSKLIDAGQVNYLINLQDIIRITGTSFFVIFEKISPLDIINDLKIYVSILASTLCLLFSYTVFMLKKTKSSFLLSFIIILPCFSIVRLASGLYDNLFSMILIMLSIIYIMKIYDYPKFKDAFLFIIMIILMGLSHFNVFGFFDILILSILISEIIVIMKKSDTRFFETLKNQKIKFFLISITISNLIIFIVQHNHLSSFLEISQIASNVMPDELTNVNLIDTMKEYGYYSFVSIFFFLYFLPRISDFKYRILVNWYFISFLLFFGRYIDITYPPMRMLLVSPIPIFIAGGFYEMFIKIRHHNVFCSEYILRGVVCLSVILLIITSFNEVYYECNLTNGGELLDPEVREITYFLKENNIKNFAFLYTKEYPPEKFPNYITPMTYYILEEFYSDTSSVDLIFFGTIEEYYFWKTDFYDNLLVYHNEKFLKRKIWYRQFLEYNLYNKPRYILIIKQYAEKEYIRYKREECEWVQEVTKNSILINIDKLEMSVND